MPANDDPGIEIRRQNKTKPTVVAVVLVAVAVALFVSDPGRSFEGDPVVTTIPRSDQTVMPPDDATSTSEPAARPASLRAPDTRGFGVRDGGGFVFRWREVSFSRRELVGLELPGDGDVQAVATEEVLAVLGDDGMLRSLISGHALAEVECCFDGLTASDEPRHVWVHDASRALLFQIESGRVVDELALDGRRVVGPGSVGLVAAGDDGRAVWLRPGFDARPVDAPEGRVAIGSGGDSVLYMVSGSNAVEVRHLADGALVRSFVDPDDGAVSAVISTSGDAVAVTRGDTTTVFDLPSGDGFAVFTSRGAPVISIGAQRFAAVIGEAMTDSTGREVSVVSDRLVLATRAE